jgi:hypothetical protein
VNSIDYGIRYADNWREVSRKAKEMAGWKCVLCEEKAVETHHALYKDKQGAIAGREIPGVHIFPLCESCHSHAHRRRNWRRNIRSPELGNKNTPAYWRLLRKGWLEKVRK